MADNTFQLTRSRGAWRIIPLYTYYFWHFNSHAHVERDIFTFQGDWQNNISTHTLTWSVTPQLKMITTGQWISTHTLTWSVTLVAVRKSIHYLFQLTRSRGAWLVLNVAGGGSGHFNSHAHVERDSTLALYYAKVGISTHTLTWSVTQALPCGLDRPLISTHTLTWSVTKCFHIL